MRIAREMGDLRLLAPGCEDLRDLPFLLWDAISLGLTFSTWQEELPAKKRPPRWMWQYGDLLDKWFEEHNEDEDSDPNDRLHIPNAMHNSAAKMLLSD